MCLAGSVDLGVLNGSNNKKERSPLYFWLLLVLLKIKYTIGYIILYKAY